MSSYAKIFLMGRVGKAPFFSDKEASLFASFNIAINKKTKSGEKVDPDWYEVVCFNHLADFAQKYIKKGTKLFIEARPEPYEYQDKEGHNHQKLRLIANEIKFCDSLSQEENEEEKKA